MWRIGKKEETKKDWNEDNNQEFVPEQMWS